VGEASRVLNLDIAGRFSLVKRAPDIHWAGDWVGHTVGLYVSAKKKIAASSAK
jgi:hypothetical protein